MTGQLTTIPTAAEFWSAMQTALTGAWERFDVLDHLLDRLRQFLDNREYRRLEAELAPLQQEATNLQGEMDAIDKRITLIDQSISLLQGQKRYRWFRDTCALTVTYWQRQFALNRQIHDYESTRRNCHEELARIRQRNEDLQGKAVVLEGRLQAIAKQGSPLGKIVRWVMVVKKLLQAILNLIQGKVSQALRNLGQAYQAAPHFRPASS